jgi:hypothetical protein
VARVEFGKESIQFVRKILFIALVERRRAATHLNATRTHRVEKITHVEPGANVFLGMHFAARAKRVAPFCDDFRRQRNVTRYDEVANIEASYDLIIGNIESSGYLQRIDIR